MMGYARKQTAFLMEGAFYRRQSGTKSVLMDYENADPSGGSLLLLPKPSAWSFTVLKKGRIP